MSDVTVVSASLNDKDLRESIDALVKLVGEKTQTMVDDFGRKVDAMNAKLRELGSTPLSFNVSADKGIEKQVQKQDEVTKAIERTTAAKKEEKFTYDQTAEAMQEAIKPKSARESYIAFQKGFKAQADAITQQIKLAEEALNKAIARRVDELNGKIANAKNKLNELFVTLEKAKQQQQVTGNYSQFQPAITRTQQQIENTLKYIDELKRKIAEAPSMFTTDGYLQAIERLKAERERISNIMREEVSSQQRIDQHTQQQLSKEEQITKEVQQQAKTIRESEQWKKEGRYLSGNDVYYDKDRANATKREKEQMLTLEEQILQKMNLREESERRIAQASRETNAALEQRGKSGAELGWKTVQGMQMASNTGGFSTQAKEIDYLRQQIAAILDVREQDVQKTNLQMATYNKLSAYLKQLQTAYHSLSADNLKREGSDIANEIQRVTRAMQQFQAQMNRPTRAYVFGLDENTLDDIAHKMQMLQRYRSGLNVDTQRNEINQVNQAYDRLKAKMDEVMAKSVQMNTINNALTRSFNYMKNRLAFYFTVGASTSFVKSLIEIRSQYEMNERALGILIDSAEKGTQVFKELSSMALVSPYTLIELSNAAKQLTAYGVAARDVVDTTRRLADISAAVGAPVERIAYALGHVQSYGYLTSLQARQFANSGIPLVKELAERYSELEGRVVSTADVYDRMKKKQVEYADVLDVVNRMTDEGGRFFDFQAKMADTLKVQLSNLNLAYNNMLNDMGKESQGVIVGAIKGLKQLFLAWKSIDKAIYDVLWTLGSAKLLLAIRIASIGLGAFGKQMTWNILVGKKLSSVIFSLASSFKALVLSPATWVAALSFAAVSATRDLMNLNEAQKEFNKSLREAGENNSKSLSDFLSQYDGGKKAIKKEDAEKVWGEMREQIELTVKKSDEFVGSLLKISDISERLRKGFELINDINEVNAALKDLDDEAIKIDTDYSKWWNANILPDGLIDEIEKYTDAQRKLNDLRMTGESLSEMNDATEKLEEKFYSLERSVSATTLSILDLIELKGWSGNVNKINAVFDQVLGKISEDNGLSPQQAFNLQMAAEKARGQAVEKALGIRIDDERAALKLATDEVTRYEILKRKDALEQELRFFQQNTSTQRVYWRDFTNWIKTQHIAETQAMFRGMDAQQIKALDFQKGQYFDWIDKLTKQYAKEHNKTYLETFDMLKNYITNANQMSIFIPLVIGTDKKKSLYEELTGADSDIDAANKKIERLTQRRNELLQKGGRYSNDRKVVDDTIRAEKELAQAQEDFNDALKKGGHIKDKNRNDSKKDPVLDSLKDEISLVKKLQSEYDKLTKKGATQSEALESITSAYGHTLDLLNKDLQSFGLPKLDLSIITGKNPHDVLKFFENLRDALNDKGLSNLDRMKAVEGVIEEFNVSVKEYNLDKVAKGLNNELGKLKDEYELAVELDANPELGGMFTSMFGIDKSELSSNIEDYMRTAQAKFDELVNEKNWSVGLNIFKASNEDWTNWANTIGLSQEALKELSKAFVSARDFALKYFKDIMNKSKDLEYKFADTNGKIALKEEELANLRIRLSNETSEIVRKNIRLQIREKEEEIASLKESLYELLPIYQKVFGGLTEHSRHVQKQLALNLMKTLEDSQKKGKNNNGNYTIIDPETSERVEISAKKLGSEIKRINSELSKSQSNLDKFVEALTKGKDDVVDIPKAFELASAELGNMSKLVDSMKSMTEVLGTDQETLDMLDEIGGVIDGIGEAFNGISQMANGDIFGGMAGIIGGLASAIGSIFGGAAANNRITEQIESSERVVKRLELAYKNLESAIEAAYGTQKYAVERIGISNKQAQLKEIQRQLELEKSRDQKYKDTDKILDLEGQVLDMQKEINDALNNLINDFMGISSVGDAVENMVENIIEALRNGESAMESFNNSIDDMIANMIKKVYSEKVLGSWFEDVWKRIEQDANDRTQEYQAEMEWLNTYWNRAIENPSNVSWYNIASVIRHINEKYGQSFEVSTRKGYEDAMAFLEEMMKNASQYTIDDIKRYAELLRAGQPIVEEQLQGLDELLRGVGLDKDKVSNLSALQQGISSISEDTASALEAYMNGVSQQVYGHTEILTDIRDTLHTFDFDVHLDLQSQMLLQLQNGYQTMNAMRTMMENWQTPSGNGIRVEML